MGVGYVGAAADEIRAMLEPLMEDPSLLVLLAKPLPLLVLREVQTLIVRDYMEAERASGVGVSGCGVDVDDCVVSVMLHAPDRELEDELRQEHPKVPLRFEYGGLSFAPD